MMRITIYLFLLILISGCKRKNTDSQTVAPQEAYTPEWVSLFNGHNLDGWTPKIKGEEPGMDSLATFIVKDSAISVSYSKYENFENRYGHLFYKKPFSSYFLSLEYRFDGNQARGGEGWAYKNSGVMFHSQSAASMKKDQDFPVSLEGQFLGGNGKDERPTMNLCTPGTHVKMADTLVTPHCITADAPTFHGNEWVKAGFLVIRDSLVVHYVNGKEVLRYTHPQLGGDMAEDADEQFRQEGTPLKEGYIALQSESHPIQFRNIALADLEIVAGNREALKKIIAKLPQGPASE